MTETPTLGMRWGTPADPDTAEPSPPQTVVNTRTALWPTRWPAIAKQECIDLVEAAPPEQQEQVKFDLPCKDCELSTACLNAKRKSMGSLMYGREILTHPRSSESSLFPRELLGKGCIDGEGFVPYWHKPFSLEHEYAVVQAWDLAWSEKIGGDWLVCETAYVHKATGRRRMLDIMRWQRLSFDEQIAMIVKMHARYRSDLVVIESDAAQQVWAKKVANDSTVPVLPHSAGGKTDLAAGVPGLLILLENRKWEFPKGPPGSYHRENLDVFFDEAEAFGWVDGKLQGVGEHDDTVMCWWHLNWGIERFLNVGQGEHRRGVVPGKSL